MRLAPAHLNFLLASRVYKTSHAQKAFKELVSMTRSLVAAVAGVPLVPEEDQHDGPTSARTGSMIARPAATHRARPWMQSVLAARKSSGVALRVPDTARAIVRRPRSPPPPGSPSSSPPRSPRSQPPTGARTVHTASWQMNRQSYCLCLVQSRHRLSSCVPVCATHACTLRLLAARRGL